MYRYFENKQELLAKIFLKVASTFALGLQPLCTRQILPKRNFGVRFNTSSALLVKISHFLPSFTGKKPIFRIAYGPK